jgi:hypothetical protein
MVDELAFWKQCCARGLSICLIPMPFKEELRCWLVTKAPTFVDRKVWIGSHTFDSEGEMFAAVEHYMVAGVEPPGRYQDVPKTQP